MRRKHLALDLRQKHKQQQKIINKLIQFLVALMQVPGLQLAIQDVSKGPSAKQPKTEQHDAGNIIQENQEDRTGTAAGH